MRTNRRPFGMSVLALTAAAIGAASLMWSTVWFGADDLAAGSILASVAGAIGVTLVVLAVLDVLLAYGVWELRSWAWPLGLALMVAAIALTLLSAGRGSSGAHTLSLVLEVGTLWYLLDPRVHDRLHSHR